MVKPNHIFDKANLETRDRDEVASISIVVAIVQGLRVLD
jgi:hypothetical protein